MKDLASWAISCGTFMTLNKTSSEASLTAPALKVKAELSRVAVVTERRRPR